MKFHKDTLLLYGVTPTSLPGDHTLIKQIEQALSAGVTLLQLREKQLDKEAFLEKAVLVRKITRSYGIPLIINDNVEIAIQCGADGVHVGSGDLPAAKVRRIMGPDRIVGVTAKTVEDAKKAWQDGADYIGAGAVFPSLTKTDALPMSLERLTAICHSVPIPVTAIGGITLENITSLKGTGIAGAAIVSGIFGQNDVPKAARLLKESIKKVVIS